MKKFFTLFAVMLCCCGCINGSETATQMNTTTTQEDAFVTLKTSLGDITLRLYGDEIDRISEVSVVTGDPEREMSHYVVFPATHYATGRDKLQEN